MCAGSDVDLVGLQVIQRLSHIAEGLFGGVLKHIVFQNGAGVASHLQALVLFLSGQDDPVGDMGKGVRRAYRSFRRSGVRDVEIRLYQGLRHEILQETGREKVYADVAHWLEAHLPEQ